MSDFLFPNKFYKALSNAQTELECMYGNGVPVSVLRALLIIDRQQKIGEKATYNDLVKALGITVAGVSRMITQLSEWVSLTEEGPGYIHIEKAYNDAGKQINVLSLTQKGQKLVNNICKID
jgi:DNA-binding MarR family transcriptional regulator